jgi:transcriptional regulator with XRE-family HTH domain
MRVTVPSAQATQTEPAAEVSPSGCDPTGTWATTLPALAGPLAPGDAAAVDDPAPVVADGWGDESPHPVSVPASTMSVDGRTMSVHTRTDRTEQLLVGWPIVHLGTAAYRGAERSPNTVRPRKVVTMDRIDSPIDLGARLREIRLERELSQRQLTRMIGLSAHSNLADYEAGRRVPPVDVLEACEHALGVPSGELLALRRASMLQRDAGRQDEPRSAAAAGWGSRVRPPRWVAFAAVSALLLGAGMLIGHVLAGPVTSGAPSARTAALSACDPSARVLDSARLVTASPVTSGGRTVLQRGADLGVIALRYSPACRLAWGRFLVSPDMVDVDASLVLQVHRLQDGAETTIRLPRAVSAESDPLLTAPGCVFAEAVVTVAHGPTVTARTGCFQRG